MLALLPCSAPILIASACALSLDILHRQSSKAERPLRDEFSFLSSEFSIGSLLTAPSAMWTERTRQGGKTGKPLSSIPCIVRHAQPISNDSVHLWIRNSGRIRYALVDHHSHRIRLQGTGILDVAKIISNDSRGELRTRFRVRTRPRTMRAATESCSCTERPLNFWLEQLLTLPTLRQPHSEPFAEAF